MRRFESGAVLAVMVLVGFAPHVARAASLLPVGLATRMTPEGLALAGADGRPLYRLDLDRYRAHRKDTASLVDERCAEVCARLWRPVAAPADFQPAGDWGAAERPGAPRQLTYKGDRLYSFAGQSLDEAAAAAVAPSYFSSYAAEPAALRDGVPAGTVYWHAALYQPPAPKLAHPAGVAPRWRKAAYVFADAEGRPLYAGRAADCRAGCAGFARLAAPLAALPVGDWRPVMTDGGARVWSYKGRLVYRAESEDAQAPSRLQALEAR